MPEKRRPRRFSSILELCLDAALVSLFLLQAFSVGCFLTFGHVPIPNKWLESYLNGALPEELYLQASSYQLQTNGSIRLEAPTLRLNRIEKPIFESRSANVEIDLFSGGKFGLRAKKLVLSGGSLYLPAVYSPNGQRTAILDRIAANLLIKKDEVAVESFAAMHESIRVRGSAFIPIQVEPSRPPREKEPRFEKLARNFFNQANRVLRETARIEGLKNPTICLQLDHDEKGTLLARGLLTSRELERASLTARNVSLETELKYTDGQLKTDSFVLFKAEEFVSNTYKISGHNLRARIDQKQWQNVLNGKWPNLELVADSLSLEEFLLEHPGLSLVVKNWPELSFSGATGGLGGVIRVDGTANLSARTASLCAKGSINLLQLVRDSLPQKLPSILFEELPYTDLKLVFSEDFALSQARVRTSVDDIHINGISFDHIRTAGTYGNGQFDFPRIYIQRDWQWLNLGLVFNPESMKYQLSLHGTAKPDEYNSILPHWWASIFQNFDFENIQQALGDFIIYGNAREKAAELFFGHVQARDVAFKGVPISDGALFVRGRGPYAEIFDMELRQPQGWARGSIRFSSRLDEIRGPESVRLDLQTRIALADARKLFPENVAGILDDFSTEDPLPAELNAAIFNRAYPERKGLSFVDVLVDCSQPLKYKSLPLEHLSFQLFARKNESYLRDLKIGLAGGVVDAQADILTQTASTNEVRFNARLKDAHQAKMNDLLAKSLGKAENTKEDQEGERSGRLDVTLHARGPIDQVLAFKGFGRFNLRNDNLASIHILGPISRLLQQARIGLATFTLDTMRADFMLADDKIDFSELRIDGPRTRIDAPGTFGIKQQDLNMRVRVSLFGNAGNPDSRLRKIGSLITNPIPNLLEFELTGTLDKQRYRSLYDPRNLLPTAGVLPRF